MPDPTPALRHRRRPRRNGTSPFMDTFISRRAKIPGWKRWRPRIPPRRITTGTSASPPSATRPTAPRALSTARTRSSASSTTTRGSASILAPRCSPGWKRTRRAPTSTSWRPTGGAGYVSAGHGSAMAQVYNHIIMPLASTRDRVTQIRWGIADFESRFHRKPEGMWLAETAVDSETLELLADNGILFTVLAPSQCARVRPLLEQPKRKVKAEKEQDEAAKGADRHLPGRRRRMRASIRRGPILSGSSRAAVSRSSFTTGRAPERSPSMGC